MGNPYIPRGEYAQFWASLRELHARLESLESAPRLTLSSVRGGAIVVLDNDGEVVGQLGTTPYLSADMAGQVVPAMAMHDASRSAYHLLVDQNAGVVRPFGQISMSQDTAVNVTSSSWTSCWKGSVYMQGLGLYVEVPITTGSGTVGEVRLEINGNVTNVVSIAAATTSQVVFRWDLTGKVTLGEAYRLRLQARRTSGANNVEVRPPDVAYVAATTSIANLNINGTS